MKKKIVLILLNRYIFFTPFSLFAKGDDGPNWWQKFKKKKLKYLQKVPIVHCPSLPDPPTELFVKLNFGYKDLAEKLRDLQTNLNCSKVRKYKIYFRFS